MNDKDAAKTDQTAPRPFRFYDNRQKYLMFVTTCGEKWAVVERVDRELAHLAPKPPALRVFDAGVGDGTVLAGVLRRLHQHFPNAPFLVVGKEISLEDVRLAMDKTADRLVEHPETVFAFTNLLYSEAPYLRPNAPEDRARLAHLDVRLKGDSSYGFEKQIKAIYADLADLWQVAPSPKSGNPRYVTPAVVTISREDRAFPLDAVMPKVGEDDPALRYDLMLAIQPYRARLPAEKKISYVLAPTARALADNGILIGVQSTGQDPGLEIIRAIWPGESPFETPGPMLTRMLLERLKGEGSFSAVGGVEDSLFRYWMHTMPSELEENIGTSTLLAAWNAAVYVAQIEDDRLNGALAEGADYLKATRDALARHGGLWFTDEVFAIRREPARLSLRE
jgi:hypothetical protein